jgi:hypothetical protein
VVDSTEKIGDMTIASNCSAYALGGEGTAAGNAVAPIVANTKAKNDNATASKAMQAASKAAAAQEETNNQAWATGGQVLQNFATDTTSVVAANTNLGAVIPTTAQLLAQATAGMQTAAEVAQQLATAFSNAAEAASNLAFEASSVSSGIGGGGLGMEDSEGRSASISMRSVAV